MTNHLKKKSKYSVWLICLMLLTPLRALVILVTPFIVLLICKTFGIHLSRNWCFVALFFLLSSVIGLMTGTTYIPNVILSLYIVLPILYVFLGRIQLPVLKCFALRSYFLSTSLKILLCINTIGYMADIYMGYDDDAFRVGYGTHFEQMNGLAIINMLMIIYMIVRLKRDNSAYMKSKIAFYIGAFLLCAYGASFIALLITYTIYVTQKLQIKKIAQISLVGIFIVCLGIRFAPPSFNYYYNSIVLMLDSEQIENNARKIKMFSDTYSLIKQHPIRICIVGFGPGSYNGRVSSLLSDDKDNPFITLMGSSMSPLYLKYIYPLWNKNVVSVEDHTDGGRNKPMSSFVSILIEYGAVVLFIIIVYIIKQLYKIRKRIGYQSEATTLYLCVIFFMILCVVEQWLETSEFLYFSLFFTLLLSTSRANIFYHNLIAQKSR